MSRAGPSRTQSSSAIPHAPSRPAGPTHAHSRSTMPLRPASRSSARSPTRQRPRSGQSPADYVQALHSFDPANLPSTSAQKGANMYLKFRAGEIIRVWSKDEKGWWDGEITATGSGREEGVGVGVGVGAALRRGWFPSNYVKDVDVGAMHDRNGSVASIDSRHHSVASIHSHASQPSTSTSTSAALPAAYQSVMLPVTQALCLLDEAIADNHVSHFQPSAAYIISAIRAALERMDCLSKDSPTLTRLPHLRNERKKVLVELSKLVACARAASGVDAETDTTEKWLEALDLSAQSVALSMQRVMAMALENGVQPQPVDARGDEDVTVKLTVKPPERKSASDAGSDASYATHTVQESVDSVSSTASGLERPALDSVDGVLDAIQRAEDALYSTMAAFIGQIHSHSRGAHPTAHAGLIRMTKLSVDCIREMLTIVETLGRRSSGSDAVHKLLEARDELYDLASRLVDSAETVAEGGLKEPEEAVGYDEDKESLIKISSEGMRLAANCAGIVRWMVAPEEWEMPDRAQAYATPSPQRRAEKVGARGLHTMSTLDRRVNGLAVQRPPLLQTASTPLLRSNERSRANSLVSPVAPKVQHRSPSRSADLDKYTADYPALETDDTIRLPPRKESLQRPISTYTSASLSTRSSADAGPATPPDDEVDYITAASDELTITKPSVGLYLAHDYETREITIAPDGSIAAATLRVIVEKMTPHDGVPDVDFASVFWDTWRLFATPLALLGEVLRRYEVRLPPVLRVEDMTDGDRAMWVEKKVLPTRLRCFHFLKTWLEAYWVGDGDEVLQRLQEWNETQAMGLPAMAMRLGELIRLRMGAGGGAVAPAGAGGRAHRQRASITTSRRRSSSVDRRASAGVPSDALPPTPIITKSLHTLLQKNATGGANGRKAPPPPINTSLAATAPSALSAISATSTSASSATAATSARTPLSAFPSLPLPPTPTIPLSEFDPLELARQLTLLELRAFRALDPVEMLLCRAASKRGDVGAGLGRRGVDRAGDEALKALSTLSGRVTGFVVDGVLAEGETKKRAGLVKFWLKVADKCLALNNFSSLFSILAGLNSSTIHRLRKTWDALPAKHRLTMDRLNAVMEHTRNHAGYRAALRQAMGGEGGVLPYLGLILTDITFTCDGNPDERPSTLDPELMLVNVDKYAKLARIAMDFRRFHAAYNLHEIEAVQGYLGRALAERGSGSVEDMYRRSLQLEPRKNSEKIGSTTVDRPGWLGGRL